MSKEQRFEKKLEGKLYQYLNKKYLNKPGMKKIYKFSKRVAKHMDRKVAIKARQKISRDTPINEKQIMFVTFQGNYTCNPKAIADEIIKQKLPYKLYWMLKKDTNKEGFPKELNFVRRGSADFYKVASATRLFVDNTHNLLRLGVEIKPEQCLLQTWHGSLGIKRLDGDIVMGEKWKNTASWSKMHTDYCISNSRFETDVFHTSYWENVPMLHYGHARNDILFKNNYKTEKIKQKVRKALNIDEDMKVLLFAPTHKDNQNESMAPLDYEGIKNSLEKRFGGKWVIAMRFHSRLKNIYSKWIEDAPDYVVDATTYDDIQDIMLITDIGLTDYSSWVFDYILTHKPVFILADDLETYAQNRSFYYPLESTPFPIALDNEQLNSNILSFDEQKYVSGVENFLQERGCLEDGNAAARIVEKIKEIVG